MTEKCLQSIYDNTKIPFKIIIIADEANNDLMDLENYNYLYYWQGLMDIILVFRKTREGIISAYNLGMKAAYGDIVFIQNDAIYPKLEGKCWLERLKDLAYKSDKYGKIRIGCVGCLNSVRVRQPYSYVGGWCNYIKRQTIEEIGYLDERFGFAMMDDIDYARRIYMNGMIIEQEKSFEVEHIGSGTLKEMNDEEMKAKAFKIYEDKWK